MILFLSALVIGANGAVIVMVRSTLGASRACRTQLAALADQLMAAEGRLNHEATSLQRRMRGVEAAAASAEREARIVSLQLTDLNGHVVYHSELLVSAIEHLQRRHVPEQHSGSDTADRPRLRAGGTNGYETAISPRW